MLDRAVMSALQRRRELYHRTSDMIWEFAEVRYREEKSCRYLCGVMEELGFTVTSDLGGLPTAFLAEWRQGDGPVIGFLGEYDALPGLGQAADATERQPLEEGAPGHGCGHNLLGTAALAAATAMKEVMEGQGLSGTVRFYGCPAEEGGAGKVFLLRAGAFEGLDACFSWHPFDFNSCSYTTLANLRAFFTFKGVSAHAAAAPQLGRSALSAVELMNTGVNYLREHLPPEGRVHAAITDAGGSAANIIQPHAQVLYSIRAPRAAQTREMYRRICKVAEGAALMTETEMTVEIASAYANLLENPVMAELLRRRLEEVLPLELTEEERAYVRGFMAEAADEATPIPGGIEPAGAIPISTDAGDVSWVVPTAALGVACYPRGTALHTWQVTAQGKGSPAKKGMEAAAYTMAAAALDLLREPERLAAAKTAQERARDGEVYQTMQPEDAVPGSF